MSLAPAAALGVDLISLANSANDSAALSGPYVIGDYLNVNDVREFAKNCDLLTFEHELMPLALIKTLESEGINFLPNSEAFKYSQDKALMREKLARFPNQIGRAHI